MVAFHGTYVASQLGYTEIDLFADPPWVAWRTAIVSQFLLLVGVSLTLRAEWKPAWRDFWRRWGQVAAASAAVSFGSALVLGERWIFFGILHAIAVALIVCRLLLPLGIANAALGVAVVALGATTTSRVFDAFPANVLGFTTAPPYTEDYVPLFPWLGVVLIGTALGSAWRRRGFALAPALARINQRPPRGLVFLGSWPLTIYLAHVPVLAALAVALGWLAERLGGR